MISLKALLLTAVIGFAVVFLTGGCSSLTGLALKGFKPEQRAEYRDGLQQATDAFDSIYDRDGYELED